MKRKIKLGFLYLVLGFVALFLLRLGYGYIEYPNPSASNSYLNQNDDFNSQYSGGYSMNQAQGIANVKRNIASYKLGKGGGYVAPTNTPGPMDQKYEKVGSLSSVTRDFEADEKSVRDTITQYKALIQFEQNSGLKGGRVWNMAIGVVPDSFDSMIADMKKIGKLTGIQIDKTDKTNEFLDLKAKRTSLEKKRDALIALRRNEGKMEERMNLEQRIFEIEEQIQNLGVNLGEFDQENEFCTVKFSLAEQTVIKNVGISFWHRVKVALLWTIPTYIGLVAFLFLASLTVLIIVVILEKLKWVPSAWNRLS